MGSRIRTISFCCAIGLVASHALSQKSQAGGDVFVVGQATATDGLVTDFQPTRVELSQKLLDERGRRELVRMLEAEQGFAHRAIPLGAPGLELVANGKMSPDAEELRKRLYQKGICANPGDRIQITNLEVKPDRIMIDLNGGPYVKHRFLRHIQVNNMNLAPDDGMKATGSRITLLFEGPVPDVTAAEVKSLLDPILDFGAKSSEEAYAETLPPVIKEAVQSHEVLVGMNRRMVLASLGQPESKLRERRPGDDSGEIFEEWIYGKVPQTIRFVRFRGDRVINLEVAALGKPLEIHDKDEMAGYQDPALIHVVSMGDRNGNPESEGQAAPPSLRKDGEPVPPGSGRSARVKLPPPQPQGTTQDTPVKDHLTP
jgi:hypothetical protein